MTNLLIRAAATWRLTRALTHDEVSRPLRQSISTKYPRSKAAYMVNCPDCVGFWAGVAMAVAPTPVAVAFALAAVTPAGRILADAARDTVAVLGSKK